MSLPYTFSTLNLTTYPKDAQGNYILPASALDDNFTYVLNRIWVNTTAPTDTDKYPFWLDTSTSPNLFKLWNGSQWVTFQSAGQTVRKNSGTNVGTRKRFNFIEGTGITLTISDDATDDEIDLTIGSSGGTRKIDFPASCFETRVATGWAEFVQVQGTNFDWGELRFDPSTDEKAISPPFRLTGWGGGNISVRIGFKANATSGDVMWIVSFLGRDTTTPEAWDAAFTDHALSAVTVPSTAEYLKEAVWTGTPSELANNDAVIMKITRDADNAGDTLTVDAKLLYVQIEY